MLPATVVEFINKLLDPAFRILLTPFRGFDPLWALLFVSLLTGLLMIWAFKKTSNQEGIGRIKDRIQGNLLAVRLYRHDVGVVLRLQGRILRDTATYLRYSFAPILVLLPPLVLFLAQLNAYFEARPLRPGETTVVKAYFNGVPLLGTSLSLEASGGVDIETPPVRIVSEGQAAWRVRAREPGRHRLILRMGDQAVEKTLDVSGAWGRVSSIRSSRWLDVLLYPGEPLLDGSGSIRSVEAAYPTLGLGVAGWQIHWLILFFVFSVASAFALKGFFNVRF